MTASTVERVGVGGRLGIGATAVGAVVLGAALYLAVVTTAGVVGALLVAAGVRKLNEDSNRDRAVGSLGLVAGTVLACLSVGTAGAIGTAPGVVTMVASVVAVAAVATDAFVDDPAEAFGPVWSAVSRSGVVVFLAAALAFFVSTGLLWLWIAGTAAAGASLVGVGTFTSLFVLQLLALGALFAVDLAVPVLDGWRSDGPGENPVDPLRQFGVDPFDVPNVVWGVLGVQALLVLLDPRGGWFDAVLERFSILGDALQWILASGLPHLPFVFVGGLAVAVVLARGVQLWFVRFAGKKPPRTLAYAAGGVVVSVLGLVVAFVPDALIVGAETATSGYTINGIATLALLAVLVALAGVAALFLTFGLLASAAPTLASTGYSLGAVALFLASMVAAGAGATPVAVFVGVACAFLAYDLGSNAAELRDQLGPDVRTRETELTHASASIIVGAVAIVVAGVAVYVVGPSTIAPVEGERATLALVLSVIALVSFAVVVED